MTADGHAGDLAGSYVLDACSPGESESVAEHANHCPRCATEIASLRRVAEEIGMSTARVPPPGLRARVLAAALATRPAEPEARRLAEAYRRQVDDLDTLLERMSSSDWRLPSGRHESLRALVAHLNSNDERVADAAGVDPPPADPAVHRRWRRQADAIIEAVRPGLLDKPVPLAGRAGIRRPLREALVQRHFETWIHAEDVRIALDLPPQEPSPRQITDIVGFALRLLPAAMATAGRAHPASAIRLVLTGPGRAERLVDLAPEEPGAGTVVAEVSMPAERFCRLLAGRIPVASADAGIDGDRGAANDFLAVAATMGCE